MIATGNHAIPHRKPVPSSAAGAGPAIKPLTRIVPDSHLAHQQSLHSRSRTTSSNVLPNMPPTSSSIASPSKQIVSSAQYAPPSSASTHMYNANNRRTSSNVTASTAGAALVPARTNSSASASLHRSASSRSSMTPNSYVALMRKQKATVWCDRAQPEDPHLSARKRANRERLAREGLSGRVPNSASGSLAVQKGRIMHRKQNTTTGYSPADLVGGVGGVPMRLSASEVGDDNSSDDDDSQHVGGHHRSGSGRSSMGSSRRHTGLNLRPMNPSASQRLSQGSTPPSGNGSSPNDGSSTPAEGQVQGYFAQSSTSTGISRESGSSGDRENSFGNIGKLHQPAHQPQEPSGLAREHSVKSPEELRRRGSIDERTTTMTNVRLFVANPDLSD